jgi:hypothetical protein
MTIPVAEQGRETNGEARASGPLVPRRVQMAIAGVVAVLLLSALYLISVRGEALLVDLAKLGSAICF